MNISIRLQSGHQSAKNLTITGLSEAMTSLNSSSVLIGFMRIHSFYYAVFIVAIFSWLVAYFAYQPVYSTLPRIVATINPEANVAIESSIKDVSFGHPGKTIASEPRTKPMTHAYVAFSKRCKKNWMIRLMTMMPITRPAPVTTMTSSCNVLMALMIVAYEPITRRIIEPLIPGKIIGSMILLVIGSYATIINAISTLQLD